MQIEDVEKALSEWYSQTHCIKHHECRQKSLLVLQLLQVLKDEAEFPEIPDCDCYECKVY